MIVNLPGGGMAMGVLDDLEGVELGPALQTLYLSRFRDRYRRESGLRMLAASSAEHTETLFFAAAAEHMAKLFERG